MTPSFPHLAQRMFNTPLAITPGKVEVIVAALADRFGISKMFRADGTSVAMMEDDEPRGPPAHMRPSEVANGVMIIRVEGTLVHKLGTMQPYSGMTGYDGIRSNFMSALADDEVKGIVLHIDSPGGEVSGCFDLADLIYQARGRKPIWAILEESAYSAAYALASACDRILVPRTGGTGSVGVICAHVDMSKALTTAGLTVSLLTYGDRKADGSQYAPLERAARARFQADVNAMGELFVATVARNRKLSPAAVRATQAGTYMGAAGVSVGFADAVMAPQAAFRSMLSQLG